MFERCLYFNVNALARRVNGIWDEAFAEFDLSPSHAYLLRLLLETPGLTQSQITRELKLEKSTITRFITALENKQLLSRERQGREVRVFPTAKAQKIQQQLNTTGDALYQKMMDSLGRQNLAKIVNVLRETGHNLAKVSDAEKEASG
ncbi:MAG TPA: MarR family transcriptional regulator [Gammaproteobacteria bacterium]|nr:MarR family transcriptional regulator [Gammaproteobacteria bacterium]